MKTIKLLTGTILLILTTVQTSVASTLEIHLENVSEKGGNVMVALFGNEDNWLKKGNYSLKKKATSPETIVVFKNIPSGKYAVTVFQDENSNKSLDLGVMGIPKEPYGFSNNAPTHFGPPLWEKAVFEVKEERKKITIHL